MESKNKKEELEIRKASSYDINFPDNKYLENSDKQRIQKAVTDGGISIGNKTFISEKELNKRYLDLIYIPIWFYFNIPVSCITFPNYLIYIPIWFYFN